MKRDNRKRILVLGFLLAATAILPVQLSAAKFNLDHPHTRIGFEVRHMVVTTVDGSFRTFEGSFDFDPKRGTIKDVNIKIDVKSIDTNNQKRDDHLRSGDFFLAETHGSITFVSTKTVRVRKGRYVKVPGKLTIRGKTKNVVLKVRYNGLIKDPWGNTKVGWDAETSINRYDYDVKWNKALKGGNFVVDKNVVIRIRGEANMAK